MFQFKNFAKSELASQLLIGGSSLTVQTGEGARFPDTGSTNIFRGVIWGTSFATPFDDADREVVQAYRSSGDTFTIVRAQEGTSAKQWEIADNFMLTATAATLDSLKANSSIIVNEIPTGLINSSNTIYTTAYHFVTGKTQVYLNRTRLKLDEDYTETDTNEITLTVAPTTGDDLWIDYFITSEKVDFGASYLAFNEIPSGLVNSSNTDYDTANSYVANTLQVYLNGQLLTKTEDYTETDSNTFTMVTAPETGDILRVTYQYVATPAGNADTLDGLHLLEIMSALNPVGTIREFNVATNPATLLGFGTWSAYGTGRVTVAIDAGQTEFDTVDETGGEKTHLLTANESGLRQHAHGQRVAQTAGSGAYDQPDPPTARASSPIDNLGFNTGDVSSASAITAHNNLQPYIVVYRWVRTA